MNVNVAVIRHVPFGSGLRLQLRAEAFNLLNRANLDLPDNDPQSGIRPP